MEICCPQRALSSDRPMIGADPELHVVVVCLCFNRLLNPNHGKVTKETVLSHLHKAVPAQILADALKISAAASPTCELAAFFHLL